jgi:crotonobetainyl-CoA:carnitine CoA-transferase CaiB-like acyl-CoA transferase
MWLFFEEPEMADDPRFATVTDRRRRSKELEGVLLPRLARYTMEELLHGLSPLRIMVGMALDMPGLVNDPHLGEREFFVRSRHPVAGEVTHPGAPFRMSETPWELESPAPLLGQHNEEVYASLLGYSPQDVESWRAQGVI